MGMQVQPREKAFWTDSPQARLFDEVQSDNYLDVIDEVDENAVTQKELHWISFAAVVAAVALFVLSHGVAAVVVGIGLAIGAAWSYYKSRSINPIVRDAKKHAWQAAHTKDRLPPSQRPQKPSLIQKARALIAGVPVEQIDGSPKASSAASAERTVRARRVRTQAVV